MLDTKKVQETLDMIRNLDKPKEESQVMDFEPETSAEEDCKKAENILDELKRIQEAEKDYLEQFGNE